MDQVEPANVVAQSVLSLITFGLYFLFKKYKRSKSLIGICLPYGKTSLCKISSKDAIFLDVDEFLKTTHKDAYDKWRNDDIGFMINLFPFVSKFISDNYKNFSNKKIYVVSSFYEVLEQLKIKKIFSFVPSKEMIGALNKPELLNKSLVIENKSRKVYVFNSWIELRDMFRVKFGLVATLN